MNIKKLTSSIIAFTLIGAAAPESEYAFSASLTAYAEEAYTLVEENEITYKIYSDHAEICYFDDKSITEAEVPSQINGVPVTVINIRAFVDCDDLLSITIPASITEIKGGAFDGCPGLTQINAAKDNPAYCSDGGVLYSKDKEVIVKYPTGREETVFAVPAGVKIIGDSAFYDNLHLKNIIIPDAVEMIQRYAFCDAKELEKIHIPDSVEYIGVSALEHCLALTEVKLPESLRIIEKFALADCEQLRKVNIPSSVTEIRSAAFRYCSSLKNVVVPESVDVIENVAFWCCSGLDNITILNPECVIGEYDYEAICSVNDADNGGMKYYGMISGYSGSTAEEYAKVIDCNFRAIDNIGDVNLDGAVDALDASLVLMEYAASATGKPSVLDEAAKLNADVNADATADALDASEILGYYAYKATGGTGSLPEYIAD